MESQSRCRVALAVLAVTSCSCLGLNFEKKKPPIMPLVEPLRGRARITTGQEFRVGTFSFGAEKGEGADFCDIIPAMILTELHSGGRFSVFEGGAIRTSTGQVLNEQAAKQYLDGYLSGTITSLSSQQVCFEVRLSNAINHEVLYGRGMCAPISDKRQLDRAAIKRISDDIERSIKKIGNSVVTGSDGTTVFFDKGSEAGVMRGMVAYVVATGDTVRDPEMHRAVETFTGSEPGGLGAAAAAVIIGEIYVNAVEEGVGVGTLFKGDYVIPGDTLYFK